MKRLIYITLALAFTACSSPEHHEEEAEEHHHHGEDLIELADSQASRLGVRVDTVWPAPMSTSLRASGVISRSSENAATAAAPVAGIVTLKTAVGQTVARGATLAAVNASAVTGGDANAAARAALDAAQREVSRLEPLVAQKLATIADLNAARAALEQARAAYSPAAGGSVRAPIGGVVTEFLVADGAYVQPGQPVAAVAADSRLTLHAEVPVTDAARLADIADARIGSMLLSEHGGRKTGVSSENGYACVYFTFDGAGVPMAGAGVEVYLLGTPRQNVVSVPLGAVVEQQGQHFVYIRHSPGHYVKQPVALGASDGARVEIVSGLKGGELVVSAGAVTVRLAESSGAVPEGHSHHH